MALNSSGPISLAGCCTGVSIRKELGASGALGLTCSSVRGLAGVASGAITMPGNFYGKSNGVCVRYYLVAGGGGSAYFAGGGGAGGVVTGTASISSLTITIGAGGTGGGCCGSPGNYQGYNGGNSTFSGSLSLTATGGGASAYGTRYSTSGGSGAGGNPDNPSRGCLTYGVPGSGISGQGYGGGAGAYRSGGGGGGATGAGGCHLNTGCSNGGTGLVVPNIGDNRYHCVPFYYSYGIGGGGTGACLVGPGGSFSSSNGGGWQCHTTGYKYYPIDGKGGGASGAWGSSGGSGSAWITYSGTPKFIGGGSIHYCSCVGYTTHVFKYSGTLTSSTATIGELVNVCAGSYTFVVPSGVTSVSALVIGGGGSGLDGTGSGGGGGGLAWVNNVTVTPGASIRYTVGHRGVRVVGSSQAGGSSCITFPSFTIYAGGGFGGTQRTGSLGGGATFFGTYSSLTRAAYCGGNSGNPYICSYNNTPINYTGGGGAAGYSGNGGSSPSGTASAAFFGGNPGSGGGGGSGGTQGSACAMSGGGVGIWGQGPSGQAAYNCVQVGQVSRKNGGSYGGHSFSGSTRCHSGTAGTFGGGGAPQIGQCGGLGVVKIMWPGNLRTWPNP